MVRHRSLHQIAKYNCEICNNNFNWRSPIFCLNVHFGLQPPPFTISILCRGLTLACMPLSSTHRHSAPGHSAFGHSAPGHSAPRTLRSQDIQLPGHSGLLDIQVFRTLRSQDIQLPGHSGLLDIQLFWTSRSFGHPALLDIQVFWTSRSFGLPVLILNCQNAGHVMLPNHSVRSYPKSIETLIIGGTKNRKAQR